MYRIQRYLPPPGWAEQFTPGGGVDSLVGWSDRFQADEPVVETDSEGRFHLDDLNPGAYLLAVRLPEGTTRLHGQNVPGRFVVDAQHTQLDLGDIELSRQ